jgi:hypothetical protein
LIKGRLKNFLYPEGNLVTVVLSGWPEVRRKDAILWPSGRFEYWQACTRRKDDILRPSGRFKYCLSDRYRK